MKKSNFLLIALFAALVMASSCRRENNCSNCNNNNGANVASSTVTVNSSDWRWENPSWRVDIDYNNITENVTDYGAVLVYMDYGNTWRQIPLTYYYSANDTQGNVVYCSSSLEVSTYDKGVSIFWTENDMINIGAPEPHKFKIVVIEANIYAARSDVDFSEYDAVRKAFNITYEREVEL